MNQRRGRVAVLVLLLIFSIVPGSWAQGTALPPKTSYDPASTNLASTNRVGSPEVNFDSSNPVQSAQQQPDAQNAPQPGPKQLTNYLETGGNYLGLTDTFGYWAGGYARGVVTQGKNIWNGEVSGQHGFGDAGAYLAAGDTYDFNPDWYGSLTAGSSVGGFFWPRFRTDAFINKKWTGHRQLITTFGFGYYAAKDVHRDHSFFVGSTYYFTKPWILEEGIRFNISNPGSVFSPAAFVAATQGRNQQHYLTIRAGFGKEAYQLIGPAAALTDFSSQTLTVTWRQWLGTNWGVNLVGDSYHSPFYARGGASFGFFREF